MTDQPIPVPGCWVKDGATNEVERLGIVRLAIPGEAEPRVKVEWFNRERTQTVVPVTGLRCGFKSGMEVMDVGGVSRQSLGFGDVLRIREIGGREQALVDFHDTGFRAWLPYQNLRQVKGVRHRFFTGEQGDAMAAERFRLRTLAYAIETWNENTGALSHLDIDPLPHQIHLVHHIIASGNLNWLIADDVGLGKTIETGMLLAALSQRDLLKRVLLITPAGLTKQWQDELFQKFGFDQFEIYGDDFSVSQPRQWKMHDHVIGSMDRFKQEDHLQNLLQAEDWDLVIVDEGHRLTRRQYGMKFDYSDRFQLAQALRTRTRAIVLLSGTPHQGMQDKFSALLELLRPERKAELQTLSLNPEIIGEMVYRNYKADVTDAQGNFVFHGKATSAVNIDPSPEAHEFDKALQDYLRRGYAAGKAAEDTIGRAIGFVMTIYRKLAASSVAAILSGLHRRRERLKAERAVEAGGSEDARYVGEWEETQAGEGREFFEGEMAILEKLIKHAERLKEQDRKLKGLVDTVVGTILRQNPNEKVLIFTEYRSTQEYLREALAARFGEDKVELLHGSMDRDERRAAILRFDEGSQFLISTEAGGEGINLQRNCHVMVNYDLPWNPMRLVQRVGRLYRYGQAKRVLVFNLHAKGTLDEDIIELMYRRLESVVSDMASVQRHEFNEGLKEDILGEIAELLDVEEILTAAAGEAIQRTQERIDAALERAREAAKKQRELFQHAAKYDAEDLAQELQISDQHLKAFVLGMFRETGIEVTEMLHQDKVLKIKLPDEVRERLGYKGSRVDVTLDRILAVNRTNTHMLDLTSDLMRFLIKTAKSYDFGGITAAIKGLDGQAILAAMLRWQDDQGRRVRQTFNAFQVGAGDVKLNPPAFTDWLLATAQHSPADVDRKVSEELMRAAEAAGHRAIGDASNRYLHPENLQWVAGAWTVL